MTMQTNTVSVALRIKENAAALADLESMRAWLMTRPPMPNVPAGAGSGIGPAHRAWEEVNASIASLIYTDLIEGQRWNG
jgi:hypothetical protein